MATDLSSKPDVGRVQPPQTPREIELKERVKALGHELLTNNGMPGEGDDEPTYYVVDRVIDQIVLTDADADDVEDWIAEYRALLDRVERLPQGNEVLRRAYERYAGEDYGMCLHAIVHDVMRPCLVGGESS